MGSACAPHHANAHRSADVGTCVTTPRAAVAGEAARVIARRRRRWVLPAVSRGRGSGTVAVAEKGAGGPLHQLRNGSHRLVRQLLSYYAHVRLHSGRASSAYGIAPSRCGPSRNRDSPKTSQVPAYDVRTCMSSRTTWSPVRSHHSDPTGVAFGMQQSLGTPNHVIFDAQ